MQRERIWPATPIERRTERNRILPITGGDGSTLNFDFTRGSLDSRLTLTRLSNATFVNLNGYVQYALANMQSNTTFDGISGTTYAIGWGGFVGTGASFERLSSGVLKCKAATSGSVANSNRAFLTTAVTVPIGLPITMKVTIRDKVVASNLDLVNFLSFTIASTSYTQYRVNGVKRDTTFDAVVIGDVITLTVLPTTAGGAFRVGLGCNTNQSLNDYVTIANVMLEQGEEVNATYSFLPNSSTSLGNFDTARFDYSPTNLGQLNGLLMEGQSTNYLTYSNTFTDASWEKGIGAAGDVVVTAPTPTTETLAPDGQQTATKITKPVGTGYGFIRKQLATGTTAGVRTASIWVKQPSTGAARYFGIRATGDGFAPAVGDQHATFDIQTGTVVSNSGTAQYTNVSITSYRNGWYRIRATSGSMTGTGVSYASFSIVRSSDGAESNTESGSLYIWGAQYEVGNSATSYSPTGASGVTRSSDKMSMVNITPMKWNQSAGSFLLVMNVAAETNISSFPTFFGMYTAAPVRVIRTLLNNSSGTNPRLLLDNWTATPTQITTVTINRPAALGAMKLGFALSSSGQTTKICLNKGTVTTTNGTGTMQTPTRMLFHQDPSAADTELFSIHLKSVKYWPKAFSNAELQGIT